MKLPRLRALALRGWPLFNELNYGRARLIASAGTVLIASGLISTGLAQKMPVYTQDNEKTVVLAGRVLADVSVFPFGVGVGPHYAALIFGVEEKGAEAPVPVKIVYAFFKEEGPLPDSFFEYSKRYELRVYRESKCDESVKSLAYVENETESGRRLPPSYVLQFTRGAPKDVLKPDAVLPCYILRPDGYRVLSQDRKPPATPKPRTATPQGATSKP